MIIYPKNQQFAFRDFGILLPIAPDRPARIIAELKKRIPGPIDAWLRQPELVPVSAEDLKRVHDAGYVDRLFGEGLEEALIRAYELRNPDGSLNRYAPNQAEKPLAELFLNIRRVVAGSCHTCASALETGFSFHLGGGLHHGHAGFGHGFCPVNGIVTAARKVQAENGVGKIWIIDVDVHKGDGTAALTEHDPSIITLSVHMARGWPLDQPSRLPDGSLHPSFIPSNIDVPIEPESEETYLPKLEEALHRLPDFGTPDLAIVLFGADVYERDGLPSSDPIRLTLEQIYRRDLLIYQFLKSRNIPMAGLMAGGYGEHAWEPYIPFLEEILCRS